MIEDEPAEPTPFDSVVGRVETELSRGRPSGAVEAPPATVSTSQVRREQDHRSYLTGVAIGVAAFATVAQLWLARALAVNDQMYAGMRGLNHWADIIVSPVWRWGVGLLAVVLVVFAHLLAGRGRRWPAIAAAVVCVAVVAVTVVASNHRMTEASQLIRLEPDPGPAN